MFGLIAFGDAIVNLGRQEGRYGVLRCLHLPDRQICRCVDAQGARDKSHGGRQRHLFQGGGKRRAIQRRHDPAGLKERCQKEIVELHGFFQDWFNATIEPTDESFARFADVMAPGFSIIGPNGRTRELATLVEGLRGAHGSWREPGSDAPGSGSIRIENIRLQLIISSAALVTYEEWHDVRGEVRGRASTVLFELQHGLPNGVAWHHVHETWLPENPP